MGYFQLPLKHFRSDWNKISLTSLPNLSIDGVIISAAGRGRGGRLTIPLQDPPPARGREGGRHGRPSQWETEMIKRLLLLTEKRGLGIGFFCSLFFSWPALVDRLVLSPEQSLDLPINRLLSAIDLWLA